MLDASAKFPSGILDGAYLWVGDFDQCMNNSAPENYPGPGAAPTSHYCNVNFVVRVSQAPKPVSLFQLFVRNEGNVKELSYSSPSLSTWAFVCLPLVHPRTC